MFMTPMPYANPAQVLKEYDIDLIPNLSNTYDGIVVAVSHNDFKTLDLNSLKSSEKTVVYDIKSFFPKDLVTDRL